MKAKEIKKISKDGEGMGENGYHHEEPPPLVFP